jgi:acyl-lipid omega-6 desaturase (Delta-12 desaturase)
MSSTVVQRKAPLALPIPEGLSKRQLVLPVAIFGASFLAYLACIVGAVLETSPGARIALAVAAGVVTANLAIIGHDAVHRSFTRVRWLNRAIGTLAFLPALHPFTRWEFHHNKVHHRYTAQIGVDNAYSPMTPEQYRAASPMRRAYYRFMRSLAGQLFFYMVDIWAPDMMLPKAEHRRNFSRAEWLDLTLVYAWPFALVFALAAVAHAATGTTIAAALPVATLYGFLIPFLVWNVFISFVTIVQHTGPRVRWVKPTGRPSTYQEKLGGTVHIVFPNAVDWFFHRVMQHLAHHVNPVVPMYALKAAEREVVEAAEHDARISPIIETWTPLYHWRLASQCKLYDVERDCWCDFRFRPTANHRLPAASIH